MLIQGCSHPRRKVNWKKMIKRSKHINLSKKQFKIHQVIQKFSTILPLKSGYHSRLEQPCLRRRAKERRCHQLHPGRYANVDIAHSYVHICYIQWIGSRKIYKNPAIFLWNMRVSCRFPLNQSIDIYIYTQYIYIYTYTIYIYIQYIYLCTCKCYMIKWFIKCIHMCKELLIFLLNHNMWHTHNYMYMLGRAQQYETSPFWAVPLDHGLSTKAMVNNLHYVIALRHPQFNSMFTNPLMYIYIYICMCVHYM